MQGASLKISTYLELSLQATSLTAAAAAAAEPPAPAAMIYLYALKYFSLGPGLQRKYLNEILVLVF